MIPLVRPAVAFARSLLRRPPVRRVAFARLPTEFGEFDICVFENGSGESHVAPCCGEAGAGKNVLTRVHSSCLTGDLFHSARCDCGRRLHAAMPRIEKKKLGRLLSSL